MTHQLKQVTDSILRSTRRVFLLLHTILKHLSIRRRRGMKISSVSPMAKQAEILFFKQPNSRNTRANKQR